MRMEPLSTIFLARGQWVYAPGEVIALEWPEGEAMPRVSVTYLDGTTNFYPMDMCGDTIRLRTKPKEKDGIKHTKIFPEEVTKWQGRGSRLQLKFKEMRCVDEVVGRNNKGTLVK